MWRPEIRKVSKVKEVSRSQNNALLGARARSLLFLSFKKEAIKKISR